MADGPLAFAYRDGTFHPFNGTIGYSRLSGLFSDWPEFLTPALLHFRFSFCTCSNGTPSGNSSLRKISALNKSSINAIINISVFILFSRSVIFKKNHPVILQYIDLTICSEPKLRDQDEEQMKPSAIHLSIITLTELFPTYGGLTWTPLQSPSLFHPSHCIMNCILLIIFSSRCDFFSTSLYNLMRW